MAPFCVIYVNFLENLDNFLCLMGWEEIFLWKWLSEREFHCFHIQYFFRGKKRSKFSDLPYEQALPFSFAMENFYQPGNRKMLIPFFSPQKIPSWENFNSTLIQVCKFFGIWRFFWERWTFWRLLNLFIVLRLGEGMINGNMKGICNF